VVFFVFAPSDEEDDESVEEDEDEPDDEDEDDESEDEDESADEPPSFFCFCGEPDLARLSVA
jgi:hypothetical protein